MTGLELALAGVLAVSVWVVAHPYTLYPLLLWMMPRKPLRPQPLAAPFKMSLLFCAYNEARALPAKLANLRDLKARYPDLQILAYDDGSSDGTREMLQAVPDLLTVVEGAGRTGKAHGMKRLAAMATGDILIFTDANVVIENEAPARLCAPYADPQVGGVLGTLHYVRSGGGATAATGTLYWRLEEWLKGLECATGNVIGADGSIFSVRRSLYPVFPDTVLDDFTVSMSVIFQGRRLVKVDDAVAHERIVSERSDEYRRKVRIAARAWHTRSWLRPQLRKMGRRDKFKYFSRKWLRWVSAPFLAVGVVSGLCLLALCWPALALLCLAVLAIVGVLGLRRSGLAAAVVDIAIAYVATFQGVLMASSGRTMVTWSPAASRDS